MLKIYCLLPVMLAALATQAVAAPDLAAPAPVASTAAPVSPQSSTASADLHSPAQPACELHVWPAERVAAITQGAGAGFGLIGALIDMSAHADQNKRDTAFITGALDAGAQAKALRELDLGKLLDLPAVTIVPHDQGIDLKSDVPQRLANSSAKCYYDFVVRTLLYLKTATTHGKMRTFIAVRSFDGNILKLEYKDSQNHALDVHLPKEGEDAGPADDALIGAFKADIAEFAEKFDRKTAKKS